MEIEVTKLRKHPKNPRKISEDGMEKLMRSIEEDRDYFNARPVIVSNRTGENVIIAGNQRFEAARKLGMKKVPVYVMEGISEDDERRILLKDNGSFGEWDWDLFKEEGFNLLPTDDWGIADMPDTWIAPEPDQKEFDENIETSNECPNCGYKW